MKRGIFYATVFAAVLLGGFFYAVINTLADDPVADW